MEVLLLSSCLLNIASRSITLFTNPCGYLVQTPCVKCSGFELSRYCSDWSVEKLFRSARITKAIIGCIIGVQHTRETVNASQVMNSRTFDYRKADTRLEGFHCHTESNTNPDWSKSKPATKSPVLCSAPGLHSLVHHFEVECSSQALAFCSSTLSQLLNTDSKLKDGENRFDIILNQLTIVCFCDH